MPLKRQPKTLFKHCIEVSIYTILMESRSRRSSENKLLFNEILPALPPTILNTLVNEVVEVFVQTVNSRGTSGLKTRIDGSLSDLLDCILSDRLTLLDLTALARLETIPYAEIVKSEKVILKSITRMNNLVSLSFKANRNTRTIPVSGNELLREISLNCPKLKYLDVSYNHTVTDEGLQYLWDDSYNDSCTELQKLFVFGCAVTAEGVSNTLKNLHRLKLVGYKETGTSLLHLYKTKCNIKLNLIYLNNMGCGMKTVEDLGKLHFSCKMSHIIFNMCPFINEIKVRVTDATLEHVLLGPNIDSVHLIFDIGKQLAVGKGLINVIQNYGGQLTTLSLVCSTIRTNHMLTIGEHCKQLNTLTVKCGQMCDYDNILNVDFEKCSYKSCFFNLENLFLTVLTNDDNIGIKFLPYIVCSTVLKNFYFSLNSSMFTNSWVKEFFVLFDTSSLESFVIDVPSNAFAHATLALTMASVDLVLAKCPQIKTIGNLFAWSISIEQMKGLCRTREIENSDLEFIYHPVPVHMNFQIGN